MRSATESEAGVESGCVLASGADWAWACGWLGGTACGVVGWACCRGGGAGALAVNAGAVFGGNKGTGFWAVWHEDASRARTASIAIRIWSFATRIVLYEIRIAPWC